MLGRRRIFQIATAAAAAILRARRAEAQNVNLAGEAKDRPRLTAPHPEGFPPNNQRAVVSISNGDSRRKNVTEALQAIDEQIRPKLATKKYVLIKPNALGTTHVDALRGILDYLQPRFKGPVVIAESSTGDTMQWMERAGFPALTKEYRDMKVSLVDLNEEAKYVVQPLIDYHLHVVPARLAARFFDPDAYILGAACFKVHNIAVVTLAVKNMVLGAPLHQTAAEAMAGRMWLDKRRYHAGIRQSLYNIYVTAARLQPFWGATIIDGWEGRQNGGLVESRVAIASTDYVAADRVGAEAMGVNHEWLGWLKYCGESGVGQWDLAKIDIRGAQLASVRKEYRLHPDIELQLRWQGPMEELPPTLGWTTPVDPTTVDA
ncbi:MAG: DUF362 domain-containing protein [Bryobacterales bacterium]|nr:DUF362 domain-containing protein [Bryobacterales bacterium]